MRKSGRLALVVAFALLLQAAWPLAAVLRAAHVPTLAQVICTAHGAVELPAGDAPQNPLSEFLVPASCALCTAVHVALSGAIALLEEEVPAAAAVDFDGRTPAGLRLVRRAASPRAPPAVPSLPA